MKDLQQAAMFRNWVQEIEKHHSYLDYLEPKEYLVDKFLEYLNERILELQKMKWNFLEANPKFMYKLYGGGDTLSLPELESHIKVKAIILERKDNKKKVASISEAIEELFKTGEPISVSIPSSIMNIKSPIEPKETPPQEPVKTPPQERTNKQINITNAQFIEDLHTALKMYFDESEHDKLMELLNGQSIEGKVKFNGKVVLFGELFKRIRLQGKVTDTKGKLAEWVVSNFQFIINGNHKDTSQSTIDNYLSKASSHTPIKVEGLE